MAATYEELMLQSRELHAAGRVEDAKRVAQIALTRRDSAPQSTPPQTSVLDQLGTGTNIGLARTFGAPVDLMTSGVNLLGRGVEKVTGFDVPEITDPIGGSKSLEGVLSPFISDAPPQTGPQRFARRIGEEVGAGAPLIAAAPAAMARAPGYIGELGTQAIQMFPKVAAADVASDVGAGAGAALAQEVAPDSAIAEVAGALAGGLTAGGLASPRIRPDAPSMDDLRRTQSQAYGVVDSSPVVVRQDAAQDLMSQLDGVAAKVRMSDRLHPKASGAVEEVRNWLKEGDLSIADLEDIRRFIRDNVAASADSAEARIGKMLQGEVDSYMSGLSAKSLAGGASDDISDVVAALREGRSSTQKIKKSELLERNLDRAERQASRSGTGGNIMNTVRQRVDSILNNDKLLKGFTPDEVSAMNDIVKGNTPRNAMRIASRFAPTTGNLQATAGLGQLAGAMALDQPWLLAPMIAGQAAKTAGGVMDDRLVRELQRLIRSGGVKQTSQASPSRIQAISTLLAQQAGGPQQ